jgi:hypothetical protein
MARTEFWYGSRPKCSSAVRAVTERNIAIDVSEEIARKGQELRETRDLDLLKVDVDSIAIVIRLRGASASTGLQGEGPIEGDPERRHRSCLVRIVGQSDCG